MGTLEVCFDDQNICVSAAAAVDYSSLAREFPNFNCAALQICRARAIKLFATVSWLLSNALNCSEIYTLDGSRFPLLEHILVFVENISENSHPSLDSCRCDKRLAVCIDGVERSSQIIIYANLDHPQQLNSFSSIFAILRQQRHNSYGVKSHLHIERMRNGHCCISLIFSRE